MYSPFLEPEARRVGVGDDDDGTAELLAFAGDYPVVQDIVGAFQAGWTPEQTINALSDGAIVGIATLCTVVAGLIGWWKKPVGLFVSTLCTLATGVLKMQKKPDGTPLPGAQPPSACSGAETWSAYYGRCVPAGTGESCSEGRGFRGPEGDCLLCPQDSHYAGVDAGCQPGCPPGFSAHGKWGCVAPTYNLGCDYDGNPGVVTPEGFCTLDGCGQGYHYDFDTEECVQDEVVPQPDVPPEQPPPPLQPGDGVGKAEDKKTSPWVWVGVAAGVAALLGGGYYLSQRQQRALAIAVEPLQPRRAAVAVDLHHLGNVVVDTEAARVG